MTPTRFLIRSLLHYWRTNLAVLLGVIAATAVMGGALVVGDSVRGSLRQMTLDRLGEIDHVLSSPRFFREELASDLQQQPGFQQRFAAIGPAIVLPASFVRERREETDGITRAGSVQLYAMSEAAWKLTQHGDVAPPTGRDVLLSRRVAEQLDVKVGDDVLVSVELPSAVPRDSLLGKKDRATTQVPLTVREILDDALGVSRLGLRPNQQLPLNAFMPLETLQSALELEARRPSRSNPEGQLARVNTLFVAARDSESAGFAGADQLNALLLQPGVLQLADLDLRLRENERWNYLSLESRRMILEESISEAAGRVAASLNLPTSPVLVYIANEIQSDNGDDARSMYSVIAGIDLQSSGPFGGYEFIGPAPKLPLGPDEIVLNDWLATDLKAEPGDTVTLKYYQVGSHGELPEETRRFTTRGILKLADTRAADAGLTPEVRGITDADRISDWDQPFEMDFDRITDRDEEYWESAGYKATPKAFVSLETAQTLWRSRYGNLTSLRMAPLHGESLSATAERFQSRLLPELPLLDLGITFTAVKAQGLEAASGTTDFGGLFIGFSFFLIISATILIGLLFRLGIERRGGNVGLLMAVGIPPRQVTRLLLAEGLLLVTIGGLIGVLAAIGYAHLMVYGLKTWWIGAIGTRFLDLYVTPQSLIVGFALSFAIAGIAVWWALRQLRTVSVRGLLAGSTAPPLSSLQQQRRGRSAFRLAVITAVLAVALLLAVIFGAVPGSQAFGGLSWPTVAFFVAGIALLTSGVSFLSAWLDTDRSAAVRGHGVLGMGRLGMRNAARYRTRSVLTVGLLASATFVVVAVAAGQRNPARETPEFASGNGGFTLVAQSATPIVYDLNTEEGREKLNFGNLDPAAGQLLATMKVYPFRMKPGDEASCLNIYRTTLPTVLGVPQRMIERGGFRFVDHSPDDKPWQLLNQSLDQGRVPVFGDMNTLMYSMHKGIGDTVAVPSEDNPQHTLQIAAMFDGAVFQGVLLMSEEHFLRIFPEQIGYRYFLIEVPPENAAALSELLETQLDSYGFDAERVVDRLADFLAVQNTYLSTFQTLGGLGLLLGTLGLATVMLRNVLERRGELALLRAVGFRNTHLSWLVMWENLFLLAWGLVAGTVSALLAMTPHLLSTGADVPWASGVMLLFAILLVGMLAAFFAVSEALRVPVLATLRSEQ